MLEEWEDSRHTFSREIDLLTELWCCFQEIQNFNFFEGTMPLIIGFVIDKKFPWLIFIWAAPPSSWLLVWSDKLKFSIDIGSILTLLHWEGADILLTAGKIIITESPGKNKNYEWTTILKSAGRYKIYYPPCSILLLALFGLGPIK